MDPAEVAGRSIARVSFKWKNHESLDKKTAGQEIDMVITGLIVSVDHGVGKCLIIIDPSFFQGKRRFSFDVNLPEDDGKYGQTITVTSRELIPLTDFYGFSVNGNDYIAPVQFETSPIGQSDRLFACLFPREAVISTAHSAGCAVVGHFSQPQNEEEMKVVFHDCALHEYAHFGSPVFNHKGLAVGICYATQSRIHAWRVTFLKKQFDMELKSWSVAYVCSNKDPMQEGGSSSGAEAPGSSAPLRRALPPGVVTLAYNRDASLKMTYLPGIIIMCERGQDDEHTTWVLTSYKALFDKVDVHFGPQKVVKGEFCSTFARFMIVKTKDKEFHEPVTWSRILRPHPGFELVESISIMAGTKLNAKASAPIITPLIGILALYAGQITSPRCNAGTASCSTTVAGTENYFQLSCSFQENFIDFSNVDLDKTSYQCDSMVSAPVFSLKGEFVGIIVCSGNWPDQKTGMYSDYLLSIVEHLMRLLDEGFSRGKLKWSSTPSV